MNKIKLKSPAKINLTLDILGKDDRIGKHFINTIFYRHDDLYDELELKQYDGDENILHCHSPGVPKAGLNTALKAMQILGITGFEITIKKLIPIQAGLGGGSSNAGTLLKYFGEQKGIPEDHLLKLAKEIGADVPFFVINDNLAYFEGFGDLYVQSWSIPPIGLEIVNTGVKIDTAEAYSQIDLEDCASNSIKTESLLKVLNNSKSITTDQINAFVHNDFENSFFKNNPQWKGKGHLCGSGGMMWRFSS